MATNELVQKDTCEAKMEAQEKESAKLCVRIEKLEAGLIEHKEDDVEFKNEIKINVIKYQNRVIFILLVVLGVMAGSIFAAILTGTLSVSIKVTWLKQFMSYVSALLL